MQTRQLITETRERLGLSGEELSDLLGITYPHLRDLEWIDDEITTTLSISQLLRLGGILHLAPRQLAGLVQEESLPYRQPEELRNFIRIYCEEKGLTFEAFSDEAGWELRDFMADPSGVFGTWNIDALKDICMTLGRNYGKFIPEV